MKKLFDETLLRFFIVGLINTLLCAGLQFVLYNAFHWGYWAASAANYIVGSIISYFVNMRFTFKMRENSARIALLFVLNIVFCYFTAYGIAKPLTYEILSGFSENTQGNVALVVGMGIFSSLNYLGQRFIVFRKK